MRHMGPPGRWFDHLTNVSGRHGDSDACHACGHETCSAVIHGKGRAVLPLGIDTSTTPGPTTAEQSGLATTDVAGGVRLVSVTTSSALVLATGTALLATVPVVDDSASLSVVAAPDGNA